MEQSREFVDFRQLTRHWLACFENRRVQLGDGFSLLTLPLEAMFTVENVCQFGVGKSNQSNRSSSWWVTGAVYSFLDSVWLTLWLTVAAFFSFFWFYLVEMIYDVYYLHSALPLFSASQHHWFICPEMCVLCKWYIDASYPHKCLNAVNTLGFLFHIIYPEESTFYMSSLRSKYVFLLLYSISS